MLVPVNEQGKRIGQHHHNAKISDEMIDKIREMHEEQGIGWRRLAKMLGMSVNTVKKICLYERRAQTPERWKKVPDKTA